MKHYVLIFSHRHGVDTIVFTANEKPTIEEAVKRFEIDFEPDREEYIEIDETIIRNF